MTGYAQANGIFFSKKEEGMDSRHRFRIQPEEESEESGTTPLQQSWKIGLYSQSVKTARGRTFLMEEQDWGVGVAVGRRQVSDTTEHAKTITDYGVDLLRVKSKAISLKGNEYTRKQTFL